MCRKLLAVLSVGLMLLLADVCSAEVLVAVDDNSIRGGPYQAGSAQNFDGNLLAKKSANLEFARKVYLKFDLGGYQPDTWKSPTFTICSGGDQPPAADFNVDVYGLLAGYTPGPGDLPTDWSETAITWNNAPANENTITGFNDQQASRIGSISPQQNHEAGRSYSVSIPELGPYLQSDKTVTLFLIVSSQTASSPSMVFASSEDADSSKRPVLVPEPSTLAMMLLAAVATVAAIRRRRTGRQ